MNVINYSIIIPVFNRPDELEKLLNSISVLKFDSNFEVVVVEDGSTLSSETVCSRFRESVNINYLFKPNSGPGDSRNYGMQHATGDYFIILDSDCILPKDYLTHVDVFLKENYVDCFGGPDAAHETFTDLQKSINYSMTSILTTGGIRGGGEQLGKFQPRSFNMGISKKAFQETGGFGKIHPGEDPDLSIRLWNKGFKTVLIKDAFVYHERRISWKLFYKQVNKFGKVRVILNKWHPKTRKVTYWFPSLFCLFLIASLLLVGLNIFLPVILYVVYILAIFIHASIKNGLKVGIGAIMAAMIQFYGYGMGFLYSWWKINILRQDVKVAFPKLFFK